MKLVTEVNHAYIFLLSLLNCVQVDITVTVVYMWTSLNDLTCLLIRAWDGESIFSNRYYMCAIMKVIEKAAIVKPIQLYGYIIYIAQYGSTVHGKTLCSFKFAAYLLPEIDSHA